MSEWDAFPAVKPASSEWDAYPVAGPKSDVSAISAAEGLPIIGAYAPKAAAYIRHLAQGGTTAEHEANIKADIAAYQQQHPVRSTVEQLAIGSLPFSAAGAWAPAARALGMVGKAREAIPLAAATGSLIGGADAAARGEDPMKGMVGGALTGAGGVAGGKALGRVWDAARDVMVDRPRVPWTLDVNGRLVPVSQSVATTDPTLKANLASEEQKMLGMNVQGAREAELETRQGMRDAHNDLATHLAGGPPPQTTPSSAGGAVASDLIAQEQARAHAETLRMAGVDTERGQLRQDLGGGTAGPATAQDVGTTLGQRIRDFFTNLRGARTTAYENLGNVPGEFNPRYMLNAGETRIRAALNDPESVGLPRSERIYVKPDLMPQTSGALQDIDEEMGRLAFTNDVARGQRPITSADIEEVRKILVQRLQEANRAARMSNNWQDVRGVRRVMQEFDRHILDTVTAPGGFTGNAQDYINAAETARQSHATMKQLFSRQGAGDKVGTFMENVIGKYPGQEMSPEKIVGKLLGKAGGAISEDAVPILTHLRDNVLGANSPEWRTIKQAVVNHLTEAAAGAEPLSRLKQAQNIERFLGNERHAGAILDPAERARFQQLATRLRGAEDVLPERGTVAHRMADLSGRLTGEAAGGEEIMNKIMREGGVDLAREMQPRMVNGVQQGVTPAAWTRLRLQIFRSISDAPEDMVSWGDRKTGQMINKFLSTHADLASVLFSDQERQMMRTLAQQHEGLVPPERTTNPSGSAWAGARMMKGLATQIFSMLGSVHGFHGFLMGKGLDEGVARIQAARQASRAADLFYGPKAALPRQGQRVPQAVGAYLGQTPPLLSNKPAKQQ